MPILTAYLDTCIISGLAKEDLKTEELTALEKILQEWKLRSVSLVTSHVARDEIDGVPEEHRFKHKIIYNLLSDVPAAEYYETHASSGLLLLGVGGGSRRVPDPLFKSLTALLPDTGDAEHLFQAAKNHVQYFLTTDVRTILSYREKIEHICNVKAVSPRDFLGVMMT